MTITKAGIGAVAAVHASLSGLAPGMHETGVIRRGTADDAS